MGHTNFDAHWLAEAIRLREARDGRLDDDAPLPAPPSGGADFEARALARAKMLAERLGWPAQIDGWYGNARLSMLLLAGLATTSGAALALAVVGDGTRPVNLAWALLGLLGVHALSLLLWLASFAATPSAGGALGRLWLAMTRRLPLAGQGPELGTALARTLARRGLARWLFGMVSHGLWTLLLASALLSLLVLFSLRRYGFAWETTILAPAVLATFVDTLDALPALLALGAPDPATLETVQSDPARAAWARWLMACVAIYGLLPRAVLWIWCRQRWRSAGRALRIDLSLPDNLLLRERLMPDHTARGVTDPAPLAIEGPRVPTANLDAGAGGALVGVEIGDGLEWPPTFERPLKLLERIETREDRRRILATLAESPPRRLLVAFDARLSPDRGSFALLADLAARAGTCAAWLLRPADRLDPARLLHWRDGLVAAGLPAERVIVDPRAAALWLEHADG